ncbi:unnamed protein product [Dovyalis caffra]|uniref:Uncharacterized protein n=1 Tax=Dovyalis caffra TaxID=77055 RepID=A0AAV1SFI4_9ROSI|nr:unnamed protein product [Dovyalis caffra]
MAGGDDILLMGASSMGSTTGTRHEQIDLMQSVGEEFSSIHEPLPPPKYPRFIGGEKVYHQSLRAREGRREGANTVLPQKERFSTESEKGRKIVQVTKAKPNVNSRSIESAGNDRKGRFIHFEATTSSHRSSPRSVGFARTRHRSFSGSVSGKRTH